MKSPIELEKMYNDALEPHAKELGLLLHAWNELHTAITYLYLAICQRDREDDDERQILLAIWNAIPNDRLQRNMVKMAAKVRFGRNTKVMEGLGVRIDVIADYEASELAEILWVLESADRMGRKRDDSAHLPLMLHADEGLSFRPATDFGHPIAQQFSGTDLVAEFSLTRARINAIQQHAMRMYLYLAFPTTHRDLPDRPEWPTSAQALPEKRKITKRKKGRPVES